MGKHVREFLFFAKMEATQIADYLRRTFHEGQDTKFLKGTVDLDPGKNNELERLAHFVAEEYEMVFELLEEMRLIQRQLIKNMEKERQMQIEEFEKKQSELEIKLLDDQDSELI